MTDDLGMRGFRLAYKGGGRWQVLFEVVTGENAAQTRDMMIDFEEAKTFAEHFNRAVEQVIETREQKGKKQAWQGTTIKSVATSAISTSNGTTLIKSGPLAETTPTNAGRSLTSDTPKPERKRCKTRSQSSPSKSGQRSPEKASRAKKGKQTAAADLATGQAGREDIER